MEARKFYALRLLTDVDDAAVAASMLMFASISHA